MVLQGLSLEAPAPLASGEPLPSIDPIDSACVNKTQSGSCGVERLHIILSFPRPGFYGAMNVTGDMLAWSLTNKTWPAGGKKAERIARFTGADGSNSWNIWVGCLLLFGCQDLTTFILVPLRFAPSISCSPVGLVKVVRPCAG